MHYQSQWEHDIADANFLQSALKKKRNKFFKFDMNTTILTNILEGHL